MSLSDKLGIVADCFPDIDGGPDLDKLESANDELFEMIRRSDRFPTNRVARLLDIGSGNEGSEFVNRYGKEFPNSKIVYIDSSRNILKKLDRANKVCAEATTTPFPDESFDIAYAGYIISDGVLKDHWHFKDKSYRITSEAHRVLKKGGLFIFTYCIGNDVQTSNNLSDIGFRELEHLQRIKWYGGIPTDTYATKK